MRLGGVVFDSIDTEISALGYGIGGETDYSSVEIGIGTAKYVDGSRESLAELIIARSEFEGLDVLEISGGGRYYFGPEDDLSPFGSIYVVNSIADYLPGSLVNLGTQIGVRFGLGAEYRIGENFFLDTSFRYLIPLVAAESNTTPVFETEFDGFSVMIGLGIEF